MNRKSGADGKVAPTMLFGRRRKLSKVRIHLRGSDPSIEGFLWRNWPVDGCYRLLQATYVEAEDRSIALDGTIDVPVANVLFLQRLDGA